MSLLTYSGTHLDHFRAPPGVERIALDLLWPSKNFLDSVLSNLRRYRILRAALRHCRPDVVVSFIDITNVLVLATTRWTSMRAVISERIDPRFHRIGRRWRIARRFAYPFCDRLVVQTESVADWARSIVPAEKVRVIPNAAPSLTPGNGTPRLRERIILGVGRLHTQKGFDLLIRAFAASRIGGDDWRLVIVGEGPERPNLSALAAELGVLDQVLLPGETQDPGNWYSRCGMFVLSSRFEGFPNVLLEAMTHAAPVISFDCPSGPRDIVRHGEDGLLLPPEDVPALTSAIARLSSDRTERTRLGEAAVHVADRYSPELITRRWEELLAELVHGT